MAEGRPIIQPRTLRGFRDYLPEAALPREWLVETARRVYRSYGYSPIDTPALEYEEILTGKGGEESDKQLYRFEDHGGRKVALRFDLTVPLARFAAQHVGQIGTPFKRYHIAAVWRGENTQRGRYREFLQCDFDTIGTEHVTSDIETALVIHDLLQAVGFERFAVQANHRGILNGVLERVGLAERSVEVLRALDKLAKVGRDAVAAELKAAAGASAEQTARILEFAALEGSNDALLGKVEPFVAGSVTGEAGLARLAEIHAGVRAAGVSEEHFRIDVSIARGLDYYTGAVFETFLAELPDIGSVCSGGRYDDLAGLYTKQRLPGIGASLGLDRLLAAMEELGRFERRTTPAAVLLTFFDAARLHDYLKVAAELRGAGLAVEFYPEPKKLGAQLKYADRRGFRLALIIGEDEWAAGNCQIKDLAAGRAETVPLAGLAEAIARSLGADPS